MTGREQTEAALRENEERLRLAQAAAGVGFFDVDLAAGKAHCSEVCFQVLGRTPPASTAVAFAEWRGWLLPADRDRTPDDIQRLLDGNAQQVATEYRVVTEHGELRWVSVHGEIRRSRDGKPVRLLGAIQDITSRKRAETQLREAHERLREAHEWLSLAQRGGQAGLWDWRMKEGALPFVSREYRDLYGLGDDELVTYDRWLHWVHPADRDRVEAYGREVFDRGSEYNIEFRIQHPTRGLRWLGSMGHVRRDAQGRAERFSGVNIDITNLKQIQEALRESEVRVRRVFDAMFPFVGVLAPDGTLTEINRAPVDILQLDRAALLGKKFWDCPWWSYDEAVKTRLREAFARALEGAAVRYDETIWIAGDGRMIIDFMLQPVFEGDRLLFVIPSAVDITDRRRAEDALRDSDRRKDEFLATLAHELRNPLAPLRTGLDLLRRASDEAARERVRTIMGRQLAQMVRLIDDLLDVSRITRGRLELKRERIPLQAALDLAVETSRPGIEQNRHELTLKTPAQPLWVEGDLTRLAQALGNLLNNAAKYTPQGGRIGVFMGMEGGRAVVRVTDNGIGIAKEMLPRVFDLFAQANSSPRRIQGGLGIGLSLVRTLVEMHGGKVIAESAGLGQGSTFTIRLPLSPDTHSALQVPPRNDEPVSATTLRVLVVDDNADAAETLASLLDADGHLTRTAYDGPNALATARTFHPDVVLLDIGLPGMSGHEVARQMRADPDMARTVLVAVTGWGGQEDKRRTQEAGFNFHLTKPVSVGTIENILAGHH